MIDELAEKTAYLQNYQMKDLKMDSRMVFVRAVARNGKFYMVMRSTKGGLKIYMKYGAGSDGRDQFKNAPADEGRTIMQDDLWSYVRTIKATDSQGQYRDTKAFMLTEVEHKNEYYEVYQVFGLPESTVSARLQNLEDLVKNVTVLNESHALQSSAQQASD